MGLDGFSLYAVIDELNSLLCGGRIDKICQPRKADIYISVRLLGQTYILHLCTDPRLSFAAIAESQPGNPPQPPTFCMLLRKQLEGGRIGKVYQLDLDRVMVIEIDTIGAGARIVTKKMYVELMGKYSNIILVEDDIIIDSLRRIGANSSRVRTVLPQQQYIPPPPQDSFSVLTEEQQFIQQLKNMADETIYRAVLQLGAGFGPVTVKEILFLAGLPRDMLVAKLDEGDFTSLHSALREITTIYEEKAFIPNFLQDERDKIIAMAAFTLHAYPHSEMRKFATMSEMLQTAYVEIDDYVSPEKEQLKKVVNSELVRQKKKHEKLQQELRSAQNAQTEKIKADNIMTYQYQFKNHADDTITVPNIYDEANKPLVIAMDKKLTVVQNMQKYYHRYDKLRRAEKMIDEQLKVCSDDINYLETIETSLSSSDTAAEIADIRIELYKSGYLQPVKKKKMSIEPSKPFKFVLDNDTVILVGKNNYQNDKLTLKIANGDDIWLHTKNIPGSHVIIRTQGTLPTQEILEKAAMLAAYYSKARSSSNVPVDYTLCKFVKKPSGAKPGFVIFTNNKTLYVTADSDLPLKLQKK